MMADDGDGADDGGDDDTEGGDDGELSDVWTLALHCKLETEPRIQIYCRNWRKLKILQVYARPQEHL